ncbi:PAQR family membrane homeostasis protein TrhA [Methylovirgula sp. 4M-Z18]|uniref:PAQR family membrane homeostasis protein TrhA n=1 Tax=Methylovirgula sp. 4M-Z18 TaxID=2293567 RepID=UPI001314DE54|nr:hemolysin III family protein [Methylovirgula sp. 4M-Z18]
MAVTAVTSSAVRREYRRQHSLSEQIADGCVHVIGILAGLSGSVLLVTEAALRQGPVQVVLVSIYAMALLAMFSASAAYNLFYDTRFRDIFRRCDHSAIFCLIAGTYTPFAIALNPVFGASLCAIVWAVAFVGIWLKFTRSDLFDKVSVYIYLAQGWLAVVALHPLASHMRLDVTLTLIAGGLLYTVGVVFHLSERLPFHNAIWHLFVLAAAVCHYTAILDGVVLTHLS